MKRTRPEREKALVPCVQPQFSGGVFDLDNRDRDRSQAVGKSCPTEAAQIDYTDIYSAAGVGVASATGHHTVGV